jgi:uncharacterized protein (TIGR02246 family)
MTDADRRAVESEVRTAFQELTAAMATADDAGVLSLIDDSAIFAFHGQVWDKAGLSVVLDAFYSGMNGIEMGEFAPLQFNVLGPDAVAVTSSNTQVVDFKDEEFEAPPSQSARTFVWVRTADGWRVLHGHISQHIAEMD